MGLSLRDILLVTALSGSLSPHSADMRHALCTVLTQDPTLPIISKGVINCGEVGVYNILPESAAILAYTLKQRTDSLLVIPFRAKNIPDALSVVAFDDQDHETIIASTSGYLGALGKYPGTGSGDLLDGANYGPLLLCGERVAADTSTYRLLKSSEIPAGYQDQPEGVGVLVGHIPAGTKRIVIYVYPHPSAPTVGRFTVNCMTCNPRILGQRASYCYDETIHLEIDMGDPFLNNLTTLTTKRTFPSGVVSMGKSLTFRPGDDLPSTVTAQAVLQGCIDCSDAFVVPLKREPAFSATLDPIPNALCREEQTQLGVTVESSASADLFSVFAPLADQDTLWFMYQQSDGMRHYFSAEYPLSGYQIGDNFEVIVQLGGCDLLLTPRIKTCCAPERVGYFPTAFSPNHDGVNETFAPQLTPYHHLRLLQIFDRRGNMVYAQTADQKDNEWDGTRMAQKVAQGVYVYQAVIQCPNGEEVRLSGDVTVLR